MADNEKQAKGQKQVIIAIDATTVHLLLSPDPVVDALGNEMYNTESRVLLPGEYVGVDEVPAYLLEKVKDGTAETLQLVPEAKAKQIAEDAARIRGEAAVATSGPQTMVSASASESGE